MTKKANKGKDHPKKKEKIHFLHDKSQKYFYLIEIE